MRTTKHTADLTAAELTEIRELLDRAFGGEITDVDVANALGGMHVLVRHDRRIVAHGAVVARHLLHGGRALRTGYVEAVAIAPELQRQGLGGVVMEELERIVRGGYEIGALGASAGGAGLYARRGWLPWRGTLSVVGPRGVEPTPGEDSIFVLPVTATMDLDGELACDWRDGDVW